MATVEDIQDVYAAQRANAEVEADIAEFDENALVTTMENSQEKIESKYLELINQVCYNISLFLFIPYRVQQCQQC